MVISSILGCINFRASISGTAPGLSTPLGSCILGTPIASDPTGAVPTDDPPVKANAVSKASFSASKSGCINDLPGAVKAFINSAIGKGRAYSRVPSGISRRGSIENRPSMSSGLVKIDSSTCTASSGRRTGPLGVIM